MNEITISFVCHHYPKKLIKYLQNEEKYSIIKSEEGIYHIKGSEIPIQLILTSELTTEENLWLKSLTDNLREEQIMNGLVDVYEAHKANGLYQSVMDIIVRANRAQFQEVEDMCKALEELVEEIMRDKIEETVERKLKTEVARMAEEQVTKQMSRLEEKGEEKVNYLNKLLAAQNRIEDILKAAADRAYQQKLFREFAIE